MALMSFMVAALLSQTIFAVELVSKKDCGMSKECIFVPPNCDPASTCASGLTFRQNGETVAFELTTKMASASDTSGHYVAVGFSKDSRMGSDAVTACVRKPSASQPEVRLSYNPGMTNRPIPDEAMVRNKMITNVETAIVDGYIVCRFNQRVKAQGQSEVFDLDVAGYVFLVRGVVDSKGELQMHGFDGDDKPAKSKLLTVAPAGATNTSTTMSAQTNSTTMATRNGTVTVAGTSWATGTPAITAGTPWVPAADAISTTKAPGAGVGGSTLRSNDPASRGGAASAIAKRLSVVDGVFVVLASCYWRFWASG